MGQLLHRNADDAVAELAVQHGSHGWAKSA